MIFKEKIDEMIHLLDRIIPEANDVALNTLLGAYAYRIFNIGNASDETKIGEYSTKPMLTGSKGFRTVSDAAAFFNKKQKWKTVKTAKGNQALAVVDGGYKEFRELNKLQSNYVDLEFKGDLKFSIVIGEINGQKVLGFNSEVQAEKAHKLESHFKKVIFKPTEEEKEIAREAFYDYLREKIQELFGSW